MELEKNRRARFHRAVKRKEGAKRYTTHVPWEEPERDAKLTTRKKKHLARVPTYEEKKKKKKKRTQKAEIASRMLTLFRTRWE